MFIYQSFYIYQRKQYKNNDKNHWINVEQGLRKSIYSRDYLTKKYYASHKNELKTKNVSLTRIDKSQLRINKIK